MKQNEYIYFGNEIHYFYSYTKSWCDCGCNSEYQYIDITIYPDKYLVIDIGNNDEQKHYISLIPLDEKLRKVLSEENIHVYINGGKLDN